MGMTKEQIKLYKKWISTRPAAVQEAATKYPIGTRFLIHDKIVHLIGYKEDGGLLITPTDPNKDYAGAVALRETICKCCLDTLEANTIRE